MLLTTIVSHRLPGLPGAAHTALRILLLTVALLLAALALVVAVCMAVVPVLPQLVLTAAIIITYAMLTQPRKRVQSC
jgi:uncharacterized protein YqgC (DUF456 family)